MEDLDNYLPTFSVKTREDILSVYNKNRKLGVQLFNHYYVLECGIKSLENSTSIDHPISTPNDSE